MHELKKAIKISRDTSPSIDTVHYQLLKHLPDDSLLLLLYIFNHIWLTQDFPVSWKTAIIIPVPKPGKVLSDPGSYRLIALTSCLCKTMERMVNSRLTWYLERHMVITEFQSGFRRRRSTVDNLVTLETSIRDAFVDRKHLVSIFFDLEKAYDTTWNHGILLDLYKTGPRGRLPMFICDFLSDRYFKVRVGNIYSDPYSQEEGVPQGSILSVTLFSLKINSIVSCLLPDIKCSLYVDDLAIYYSSSHMPSIERRLQQSLNRLGRWCDENGFKFSPTKTMCVHFCQLRKLHLDPELYLNGTQIPIIGETKFLGLLFDSKLSHSTHHFLEELCLGAFRTSSVQSLYVEANEPPLGMRRTRLSLQYCVKLMSNEVNPAYSAVFQSDFVATYEAKERAIKPLGLRIERHLDEVGFHTHVIAPYTVMKTPPWKLIEPTVCFDLCKYKKSETDPTLYRLYYSELLESFTDYTHIFTDGSKDGAKTAAAFICQFFEFSKRLPDKASIFTAELEAIVSALRYVKSTTKINKFVIFGDSKSALQALWDPSGIIPQFKLL